MNTTILLFIRNNKYTNIVMCEVNYTHLLSWVDLLPKWLSRLDAHPGMAEALARVILGITSKCPIFVTLCV